MTMTVRDAEAAAGDQARAVESRAGQDMLINQVSHITNQVESLAIERIDTLINRLTSLKERIIQDNKESIDTTVKFIEMVDGGLRNVERVEDLVERLEVARTR